MKGYRLRRDGWSQGPRVLPWLETMIFDFFWNPHERRHVDGNADGLAKEAGER